MSELNLSAVPAGKRAVIKGIKGGKNLKKRLLELGITENSQVEVIKNNGCGPLIIASGNCRFAIGRGMAIKIEVDFPLVHNNTVLKEADISNI